MPWPRWFVGVLAPRSLGFDPRPFQVRFVVDVVVFGQGFLRIRRLCHFSYHSTNDPHVYIYRVSQEECARLRESVPYVKVCRYNPKHLYPKLNSYGNKGQRKVRSSCGSTYCTCSADALRVHQNAQSAKLNQYFNTAGYSCAM